MQACVFNIICQPFDYSPSNDNEADLLALSDLNSKFSTSVCLKFESSGFPLIIVQNKRSANS